MKLKKVLKPFICKGLKGISLLFIVTITKSISAQKKENYDRQEKTEPTTV
jgi:hypothetical protein